MGAAAGAKLLSSLHKSDDPRPDHPGQGLSRLPAWWGGVPGTGTCYLLDVLLEDAELQPLVQPHLAVLPDALEAPLVVQHLVHHVQHLVHCLGVVGCGREGLRVPGAQGTLQHIQQGLAILADLQEGKRVMSKEWTGRQGTDRIGG